MKVLYVNKNIEYSNIACFVITFIIKLHQIDFKAFYLSSNEFILKNFYLKKQGILRSFFRYCENISETLLQFFVITFFIKNKKLCQINFKALNFSGSVILLKNFYLKKQGILRSFFWYCRNMFDSVITIERYYNRTLLLNSASCRSYSCDYHA